MNSIIVDQICSAADIKDKHCVDEVCGSMITIWVPINCFVLFLGKNEFFLRKIKSALWANLKYFLLLQFAFNLLSKMDCTFTLTGKVKNV